MKMNLDQAEIRVLGSLIEKELTTPENYPLSLNSLLSACNQKSNREPVLALTEADAVRALEALGARGLARLTTTGGRVARYRHNVAEKLGLGNVARAVLAELMLRGPQTAAELRNRGERMADVGDLAAVEETLAELQRFGPPLVVRLPRESGRKESRYAQVLSGMPDVSEAPETTEEPVARQASPRLVVSERLVGLEEEVRALREELSLLRREIEAFMESFR